MPLTKIFAVDKDREEFHMPLGSYADLTEALFHAEGLSLYTPSHHAVRIYLGELPVMETNCGQFQSGLFYWQQVNSFLEVSHD